MLTGSDMNDRWAILGAVQKGIVDADSQRRNVPFRVRRTLSPKWDVCMLLVLSALSDSKRPKLKKRPRDISVHTGKKVVVKRTHMNTSLSLNIGARSGRSREARRESKRSQNA